MGHFHAYECVCPGGRGESVSNLHFLVQQPVGFCVLKKQTRHSACFRICHFLARHFMAKGSFHSSVCSLHSCQNGRLMKTEPSAISRKIQKLITTDLLRGLPDRYTCIVKSSRMVHHT